MISFNKIKILIITFCTITFCSSCRKSSFLDVRPDNALVVPQTIPDLQALLDNDRVMNGADGTGVVPSLGEVACTDYFVNENDLYSYLSPLESNAYTWQQKVFNGEHILDWNLPYKAILYANAALDGVQNITPDSSNVSAWNNIKGSALFYRAFMYWQLAQIFAPPYDSIGAATDWGIPLKASADINESIHRSTVAETYKQIKKDLTEAMPLLPDVPLYATRPSKAAAHAMLARVMMDMQDYNNALKQTDSCLQLQSELIDYNLVDTTAPFPFEPLNSETIFYADAINKIIIVPNYAITDTTQYNSYDDNDLRKKIYFSEFTPGKKTFSGSYGKYALFAGITTDEMILTRAECYARTGKVTAALQDLNTLLEKRYRNGSFIPYIPDNVSDPIKLILNERHKELVMRCLYWTDLRRLNKEGTYTTTLKRIVSGTTYTLPPNDPRYTYPIPDEVISFNPDMPQNQR